MSKVIQVLADLSQSLKSNGEEAAHKKSNITLVLGLIGVAGLLLMSYLNNGLFFDRLLVISGILSCILLVRTMGGR